MDERVQRHAEVVVEHSTDVGAGDDVLLFIPDGAEALGEAIAAEVGKRGGALFTGRAFRDTGRIEAEWLRSIDPDDVRTSGHELALVEAADVVIAVRGGANLNEQNDVAEETIQAMQGAYAPVRDAVINESRWCGTQYPSTAFAQRAGMSTRAYEDFVWDAILRDWDAVREHQEQLVEIIEDGSEVRIRSGDTTDISAHIDGMLAKNDYGENNLPGGEVFTAPVVDSVEGEVLFDVPVQARGRELENVRMTVEDGEIVELSAEAGEELLTSLMELDGADRFGELGFGMNRQIDRPTQNMLLDEKLGDTVHMAIGRAYEMTVGDNRERNESSVHADLIVDMSEDSRIEVDGEPIYEDGWYVFEDGFGA
jgi:aminopeptidase